MSTHIRTGHPTLFSSAMIISIISALFIFVVIESILKLVENTGMTIPIEGIIIFLVLIGVLISSIVLFFFASRVLRVVAN